MTKPKAKTEKTLMMNGRNYKFTQQQVLEMERRIISMSNQLAYFQQPKDCQITKGHCRNCEECYQCLQHLREQMKSIKSLARSMYFE